MAGSVAAGTDDPQVGRVEPQRVLQPCELSNVVYLDLILGHHSVLGLTGVASDGAPPRIARGNELLTQRHPLVVVAALMPSASMLLVAALVGWAASTRD